MRARTVVLLSLSILLFASITLSWLIPPVDDLWLENPFWNGLSDVQTSLKPQRVTDISLIPPGNSTVLMLGPSSPYTEPEIVSISNYLNEGGRVVLTDDFGTGNTLLEGLGLTHRFSGTLLEDTLFKERKMMPRIFLIEETPATTGIEELILNYPTTITGLEAGQALAYASYFSDLANSTQVGPFPVLAEVRFGKGTLYLIADSSIFINGMLERGDNHVLLENLSTGVVAIDEAHSTPSRLTEFKAVLTSVYAFIGHPEVKYSLAIIAVVAVFKVTWEDRDEQPDEVEETLRRHPEWSRRELEELREARRRVHGDKQGTG